MAYCIRHKSLYNTKQFWSKPKKCTCTTVQSANTSCKDATCRQSTKQRNCTTKNITASAGAFIPQLLYLLLHQETKRRKMPFQDSKTGTRYLVTLSGNQGGGGKNERCSGVCGGGICERQGSLLRMLLLRADSVGVLAGGG